VLVMGLKVGVGGGWKGEEGGVKGKGGKGEDVRGPWTTLWFVSALSGRR